jgi:glycosyltransferase involved in cell wall biosynthesis
MKFNDRSLTAPSTLLLHLSIGSPLFAAVAQSSRDLVINYHDITPPHFFEPFGQRLTKLLIQGREQLHALSSRAKAAWADSEFSQEELVRAGYRRRSAIPILLNPTRFTQEPDSTLLDRIHSSKVEGPDVLFVGRVVPNKCVEDLIGMLHVYRQQVGRGGRLFLVGPHPTEFRRYVQAIIKHGRTMLGPDVIIVGPVPPSKLAAYYKACDVYVSMSKHEGFGVPFVEAMHHDLPILALEAGATRETVGDAGLVLARRDLLEFAVALNKLYSDTSLKRLLTSNASSQRQRFEYSSVASRISDFIQVKE